MELFIKTKDSEYKINSLEDISCVRTHNYLKLCVSGYDGLTNWKMIDFLIINVTRINEYYGPCNTLCEVHKIDSDGDLLATVNQIAIRMALEAAVENI